MVSRWFVAYRRPILYVNRATHSALQWYSHIGARRRVSLSRATVGIGESYKLVVNSSARAELQSVPTGTAIGQYDVAAWEGETLYLKAKVYGKPPPDMEILLNGLPSRIEIPLIFISFAKGLHLKYNFFHL